MLAALRDVRNGGMASAAQEEEVTGRAAAAAEAETPATTGGTATSDDTPLSFSSLTPGQKQAALQLLFSRLRDEVVFVSPRRGRGSREQEEEVE